MYAVCFFFSSRRRHTRSLRDWSSDVCSSDLRQRLPEPVWEERGEYEAPRDEVEGALAEVWSEVLRAERVGVHDNFFELGGDSILSIQVVARAAERGLRVTSKQLFQQQTIAELGRVAERTDGERRERESGVGMVPLTPVQRWLFEEFEKPGQFSQSMLLRVSERVSAEVLRRALGALVSEHEQLRARYWREESGEWRQEVSETWSEPELLEAPVGELDEVVERLQGERELGGEAMLRGALLRTGEGEENLLFVDVHHLVVDGVSWRVLVGDLEVACEQLLGGREVRLAEASTSFKRWSELLEERAGEAALLERVEEWTRPERVEAGRLALDLEGGENLASSAESVT